MALCPVAAPAAPAPAAPAAPVPAAPAPLPTVSPPAPVTAATGPTAVIDALDAALLETMKQAAELGMQGRYDRLKPVLDRSFDFERMISVAAGSYWTQASEDERRRLLDAFTDLSITTYAAQFDGWSGESFATLGQRAGPRDSVLVDTSLERGGGKPAVSLTYVLTQRDGTWRIVDVLLDRSISQLAVRRSEYSQELRDGGPERLARTLDQKSAELRGH